MFKPLSLLIHRTPWWGLLLGGLATLALLALFAAPLQVFRLTNQADTPQQRRAIQQEINQAFKNGGLGVAEGVLGAMRDRAQDPERQRELDHALAEIARARGETLDSANEIEQAAREAAQEALEAAQLAAQEALDTARDTLQTVRETREQALEKLREKGLATTSTEQSFDGLINDATHKEQAAQAALEAIIARSRDEAVRQHAAQQPVAPPAVPGNASAPQPPIPPVPPLSPELRENIRHTVAGDMWRAGIGSALILAFIPLFVMLLIAKYFIDRSHRVLAFAQEKNEEAHISDMQRQMTEARLQALQAQVEPHFLYNTLANVQALTEIDPPAANQLVGHLIEYLRAALPKMRESRSTVGQEVERVRAYLSILRMRMGERLEFAIHVHESLLALPFPPMMLPSLVENAIKHGLEPKREGGRIDVLATRVQRGGQERLVLQVKDTGAGLHEHDVQSGSGVGLSNLRERLRALYGADAHFTIEANQPQGVVCTIDIPVLMPEANVSVATGPTTSSLPSVTMPTDNVLVRGFRRAWGVTRKTHGVWAQMLSRLFVILMAVLLVLFFVGFVGVVLGWVPMQVNDLRFDGVEGMALGSLGLLLAFGVLALVVGILLLVLYGMGFLFVGLLIFIPTVILISMVPALSPFILLGLLIYWWVRRKQRSQPTNRSSTEPF